MPCESRCQCIETARVPFTTLTTHSTQQWRRQQTRMAKFARQFAINSTLPDASEQDCLQLRLSGEANWLFRLRCLREISQPHRRHHRPSVSLGEAARKTQTL